jgi:chromosome segregation ATPase
MHLASCLRIKGAGKMSQAQKDYLFMNNINEPVEQDLKVQLANFSSKFQNLTNHLMTFIEEIDPLPPTLETFSIILTKVEETQTLLLDKQKEFLDVSSKLISLEQTRDELSLQYTNLTNFRSDVLDSISALREDIQPLQGLQSEFLELSGNQEEARNQINSLPEEVNSRSEEIKNKIKELHECVNSKSYLSIIDIEDYLNKIELKITDLHEIYDKKLTSINSGFSDLSKQSKQEIDNLNLVVSDIRKDVSVNTENIIESRSNVRKITQRNKFSRFFDENIFLAMIVSSFASSFLVGCLFLTYFQSQSPQINHHSIPGRE